MGIKDLNRFITDNCKKHTICKKGLKTYANKTIVIDTSIYMYKYSAQNALVEHFYFMMTLFKEYKITPLFVFDGKPPPEKHALLRERSENKKLAEDKYNILKSELENSTVHEIRNEIILEMDCLKKQFVRINRNDIQTIKTLITSYGSSYYEAPGEADRMCVELVLNGTAWACLSDDMDMLVYGCPRVLRHLSLLECTVLYYDLEKILFELDMDLTTFRQIMVLSGTDYNLYNINNLQRSVTTSNPVTMNVSRNNSDIQTHSLHETMKWYSGYMKRQTFQHLDFYNWLHISSRYITNFEALNKIYNMFCIDTNNNTNANEFIAINNRVICGQSNSEKIREILSKEGFIFV